MYLRANLEFGNTGGNTIGNTIGNTAQKLWAFLRFARNKNAKIGKRKEPKT